MCCIHHGINHVRSAHLCTEISEQAEYNQKTKNTSGYLVIDLAEFRFHSYLRLMLRKFIFQVIPASRMV